MQAGYKLIDRTTQAHHGGGEDIRLGNAYAGELHKCEAAAAQAGKEQRCTSACNRRHQGERAAHGTIGACHMVASNGPAVPGTDPLSDSLGRRVFLRLFVRSSAEMARPTYAELDELCLSVVQMTTDAMSSDRSMSIPTQGGTRQRYRERQSTGKPQFGEPWTRVRDAELPARSHGPI